MTGRRDISSVMKDLSNTKNKLKKILQDWKATWYLDNWIAKAIFLLGGFTTVYLIIKLLGWIF